MDCHQPTHQEGRPAVLAYEAYVPGSQITPGQCFLWFCLTLTTFVFSDALYFILLSTRRRGIGNTFGHLDIYLDSLITRWWQHFNVPVYFLVGLSVAMLLNSSGYRAVGRTRWCFWFFTTGLWLVAFWLVVPLGTWLNAVSYEQTKTVTLWECLPFIPAYLTLTLLVVGRIHSKRQTSGLSLPKFAALFWRTVILRHDHLSASGSSQNCWGMTSWFMVSMSATLAAQSAYFLIVKLIYGGTFSMAYFLGHFGGNGIQFLQDVFDFPTLLVAGILTTMVLRSGCAVTIGLLRWWVALVMIFLIVYGLDIAGMLLARSVPNTGYSVRMVEEIFDSNLQFLAFLIAAVFITRAFRSEQKDGPYEGISFWLDFAHVMTFLPLTPATYSQEPSESRQPSA